MRAARVVRAARAVRHPARRALELVARLAALESVARVAALESVARVAALELVARLAVAELVAVPDSVEVGAPRQS